MKNISFEKILAQADFITSSMLGKSVLALVVVSSVLNAVFLSLSGFQRDAIMVIEVIITLIYVLISSILVTGLAEELGTGQAIAHLVHPISNEEYMLAWLLSGPGLLGISYVLAILTPILVISPRSITNPSIYEPLVYGLGELLYLTLLALMLSVYTRNRSRASLYIIVHELLTPVLVLLALAIIVGMLDIEISESTVMAILGIWHPVAVLTATNSSAKTLLLIYAYGVSFALFALLYQWAKRMEV
ncbi:hypothetical protein PYJP_02690 [Pyrofollis japonicus]|uniref:hypothetical protein n=1 Tax=Pyrofollis japonicus TaxID=3060460 RepID=UPI00295C2A37|nr:hypothetical protein [Pyrofollis japonicus]BEP16917.1 hypothetical protein PYJP_02690 [Pyrofollis japonicus]